MNNRAVTISLLMAIVAVFFVNSYVTNLEEEAKKKYGEDTMVIVAKEDISELQTLNRNMLDIAMVPSRFKQPGAIGYTKGESKDDGLSDFKNLEGTVALIPIKKGEQITFSKISEPGVRTGLSSQITPGKRAVAIPVSDSNAAGRLIKPGDRVDILLTMHTGGDPLNRVARAIAQDVTVLATGRSIVNNVPRTVEETGGGGKEKVRSLSSQNDFGSLIVEVEPQLVPAIALAASMGPTSIQIVLRTTDDNEKVNLQDVKLMTVMGITDSRLPAAQGPKGATK
ncbi:MAG: Flp pilus assembly protein CpaB [Xanthomonadaceae bacterium]|nr:Flp pilus assembly protein CpaB [Xanthomonadaceae bacterium]